MIQALTETRSMCLLDKQSLSSVTSDLDIGTLSSKQPRLQGSYINTTRGTSLEQNWLKTSAKRSCPSRDSRHGGHRQFSLPRKLVLFRLSLLGRHLVAALFGIGQNLER